MKLLLIGMSAIAAASSLVGSNWYRVAEDRRDLYFVDRASVSRSGDQVRAEVLYADRNAVERPFSIDISFDCAAKTATLNSVQYYSILGSAKDGGRTPFPGNKVQNATGLEAVLLERLCTNSAWSEPAADPFNQIGEERLVSVQGCNPPANARLEACLRRNRR